MTQTRWFSFFAGRGWTWLILLALLTGFLAWTARDWPWELGLTPEGRRPKPEAYARTFAWWALLADGFLLLGLRLTQRWWTVKGEMTEGGEATVGIGRRGWAAGLFLLVLAGVWRWERMDLSLYNDEAHNFVRVSVGFWKERNGDEPGPFREVKWTEAWWWNQNGSNSQPHSVLSRLCHELWRKGSGGAVGEVNETALRLPAFVAGMLGLGVLGLAVRSMAGNGAAFWTLLAGGLHGWHLRYSTEARGYSLMLLGVVLGWWFLDRALKRGRWRDWAGYGAGMALAVWSFPGAVYFVAVQHGLLMARQAGLWMQARTVEGWAQVCRPMVAALGAVMVVLPLLLPIMPQLMLALKTITSFKGGMGLVWWRDVGSFLLLGCRWQDFQPENPLNVALARLLGERPWLLALALGTAGMVLAGSGVLWHRGGSARLLVLSGPLSVGLAWLALSVRGLYLHHWYVIFALPWVLAALAAGVAAWRWRPLQAALGLFALGLPTMVGGKLRNVSKEDARAVVLAVRGAVYPHGREEAKRPLLGSFWSHAGIYDPLTVMLLSDADFEALVQRALREKRDLYVNYAHHGVAVETMPQAVRRLENPAEFERVGVFWGLEEPQFTQFLFKMKRGAE